MPKTRLVTRSVTNVRPPHMTLDLECSEEPLSEAQLTARVKLKEQHDKVAASLEELIKENGGKMVCQAGAVNGYQYSVSASVPQALVKNTTAPPTNQSKNQQIKLNINNANNARGNIQLVVDPRMGVILESVAQQQDTSPAAVPTTSVPQQPQAQTQVENFKYTRSRKTKVIKIQPQPDVIEEPPSVPVAVSNRGRPKSTPTTHVVTSSKKLQTNSSTTPQGVTNIKIKTISKQPQQPPPQQQQPQQQVVVKPTEQTSIGGIAVGKNTGDTDDPKKNFAEDREIPFSKVDGSKTYPSLIVVARPYLHMKDIIPQIVQKERSELDIKVKSVLMFSATKFAEWLIQQGLVRSEQYCTEHASRYQRNKFKLGMYSDQGTFPYSGGYVWISNCCPDRFVSVFAGSIFQGAPYTPTVLLKLIYHWACQTNVQNVISWVKVSNTYIKNFYTNIRSVCTAAVCDKSRKMGGKNSMIQVGVISLGTTSQDGNLRQVKVEVLGVLDPVTLDLRLRACDPVQDGERSFKRRFNNILYPLKKWVHTDSRILTDYTVDKGTLHEMGFIHVIQTASSEQNLRNMMGNYYVMEYLRRIVPRMFQNTLSLLSRPMIQQFLDELVWREMYGSTPARAFDNIILHIAEQTKLDSSECLIDRLAKIAANPFQNWAYTKHKATSPPRQPPTSNHEKEKSNIELPIQLPTPSSKSSDNVNTAKSGLKKNRKRPHPDTPSNAPDPKKPTHDSQTKDKEKSRNDQIQLQEFYYATMEGDKTLLLSETKCTLYFKCFLCMKAMRSNTDVMQHMINHVPPRVPGQKESPVCRYCCTAFSSPHQMATHVTEAHSNFGHSNGGMVVCAICEEKYSKSDLLINHLQSVHYPSEMPYKCESCGYRTSSHKDAIDHYYQVHEKGDGLQCPYCLKVIKFVVKGKPSVNSVHTYLLHMQRHVVRREQGRGNKCLRCCLWFNQKSSLRTHQKQLHDQVSGAKVIPYTAGTNGIMISKYRPSSKRFEIDSSVPETPRDEKVKRWSTGPVNINTTKVHLPCKECEEDIDEIDHYPGEQRCHQCRYVTCCWRAFREHQQQIHNERPMTGLVVPPPLITIPLEKKMRCSCEFATTNGNELAAHLVKCKKNTVYSVENTAPSGMLNSLGLVPKNTTETTSNDKTA